MGRVSDTDKDLFQGEESAEAVIGHASAVPVLESADHQKASDARVLRGNRLREPGPGPRSHSQTTTPINAQGLPKLSPTGSVHPRKTQ